MTAQACGSKSTENGGSGSVSVSEESLEEMDKRRGLNWELREQREMTMRKRKDQREYHVFLNNSIRRFTETLGILGANQTWPYLQFKRPFAAVNRLRVDPYATHLSLRWSRRD
jgi:hypothetical protein